MTKVKKSMIISFVSNEQVKKRKGTLLLRMPLLGRVKHKGRKGNEKSDIHTSNCPSTGWIRRSMRCLLPSGAAKANGRNDV